MTLLPEFLNYILAFEEAFVTNQWEGVAACFAEDAAHRVDGEAPLGREAVGCAEIVAAFGRELDAMDRRFDQRIPEIIDGPNQEGDSIWMRWALVFRRDGLPSLRIEGEHRAVYGDGKIVLLEEKVEAPACQAVAEYLATHDTRLHPVGGAPSDQAVGADEAGATLATAALQRTLVRFYGAAKSHADIAGALSVCGAEFSIHTVPLGVGSHTREQTEEALGLFFAAFPDYRVELEGVISEGGDTATATAWGNGWMTPSTEIFGDEINGRTAELDIFCVFGFRDGLLASERFFFDLASFCRQTGVDPQEFRALAGSDLSRQAA